MVRTQLDLDDDMHRRRRGLARKPGRTVSVSDLVREALVRSDGKPDVDRLDSTLTAITGLWRDRDDIPDDPDESVRWLRRGTRLRRLLGTSGRSARF